MIGPRPCAYPCAYVDPVFTSQGYDISISTSTKNELVRFSCAYAYVDQFSLAYTCAYAHAYAYVLVKTRLYLLRVPCCSVVEHLD